MQWSMQWQGSGERKEEGSLSSQNRSDNFHVRGLSWLLTSHFFGELRQFDHRQLVLTWDFGFTRFHFKDVSLMRANPVTQLGIKKIPQLMRYSARPRRCFQISLEISTPICGKNGPVWLTSIFFQIFQPPTVGLFSGNQICSWKMFVGSASPTCRFWIPMRIHQRIVDERSLKLRTLVDGVRTWRFETAMSSLLNQTCFRDDAR